MREKRAITLTDGVNETTSTAFSAIAVYEAAQIIAKFEESGKAYGLEDVLKIADALKFMIEMDIKQREGG